MFDFSDNDCEAVPQLRRGAAARANELRFIL
jgi:hypothetical protein